ncbi:MAG: FeoB-associated Cys-rich membrane protein [Eubacterium sp.]|nr:FeoB-associated Cys-rich membrane protein [Eubacterium sp.]
MITTVVILALIFIAVGFALRYTLQHPDSCEGCGSSCSGSCSTKHIHGRKNRKLSGIGGNQSSVVEMEDRTYRNQALAEIWKETRAHDGKN